MIPPLGDPGVGYDSFARHAHRVRAAHPMPRRAGPVMVQYRAITQRFCARRTARLGSWRTPRYDRTSARTRQPGTLAISGTAVDEVRGAGPRGAGAPPAEARPQHQEGPRMR